MELTLNGKVYPVQRLKLRRWLSFEHFHELLQKSISDKDGDGYANTLTALVADALGEEVTGAPWYEMVNAYNLITECNQVKEIPLLKSSPEKRRKQPWEYDGRSWYWWLHTLAKTYGWTSDAVEELDIDDATALLQEILTDVQWEREWQWQLSEIAYPYNPGSKKNEFHALERPDWMEEHNPVILRDQKVRFHKSMLPVGMIIGEDGNERLVH